MTHEQYITAKPLEQDIDLLTGILANDLAGDPPASLDLKGIATICNTISGKLSSCSGDPRITNELHDQAATFYTALRTSLNGLLTTITADRDAI